MGSYCTRIDVDHAIYSDYIYIYIYIIYIYNLIKLVTRHVLQANHGRYKSSIQYMRSVPNVRICQLI